MTLKKETDSPTVPAPPTHIAVVGQTPPPYGGQAIMIKRLLEGDYPNLRLHHVRMAFSKEMDEIGKFRISKIVELVRVIARILMVRGKYGATVLYYPPAGPELVPVLRDIVILLCTRFFFKKTIFHFHASGLSTLYAQLPALLRPFFRKAYFHADVSIRLSRYAPEDPKKLSAEQEYIVPYGITDEYHPVVRPQEAVVQTPVNLLFVGVLRESKGVLVFLEACRLLAQANVPFQANLMGKFESEQFQEEVLAFVRRYGLEGSVRFLGVLTGAEKREAFTQADVFCFPTHFESEALSVVLIEALSFGLPIVATQWRGLPSLVEDGDNGFLVPIKDPEAVADRLRRLISDPDLRRRMGQQGRARYLDRYTVAKYHERINRVFQAAA